MIGLATDKRPAHISNDFAIGDYGAYQIGNTISYSPYWRREDVNLLHGNQLSNTEMSSFLSKYIACFKVYIKRISLWKKTVMIDTPQKRSSWNQLVRWQEGSTDTHILANKSETIFLFFSNVQSNEHIVNFNSYKKK